MYSPAQPQSHRWFPGYTVAAVSTVALFASAPGQTFIVSQLNGPLRETFDIEPVELNTAYTIATIAASLPLVYVGALTDKLGPRRMMALVAVAFGLGCFAMSAAVGLFTVFLGFFLLRFLGQGSLTMVSQHALAMWFHRRLGSIHGFKLVIVFALWVFAPQLSLWLMGEIGWRWTYIAFGCAVIAVVVPLALIFLRDRPEHLGLEMDNDPPEPEPASDLQSESNTPARAPALRPNSHTLKQALRTRAYWTLAAGTVLPPMIGTAFLFDMEPILALRGMSRADAANAVSAWSAAMAIFALPAGALTDRLHPRILLALGLAIIAGSSLLLMIATTPLLAAASTVSYAIGQASVMACASATVARYFGRAHHGAIRSSVTRLGVIGTGLGPFVTGWSVELTDGYSAAMILFAAICIPAIIAAFTLNPPPDLIARDIDPDAD